MGRTSWPARSLPLTAAAMLATLFAACAPLTPGPSRYATPEDAVAAAGFDPAEMFYLGTHAAVVDRDGHGTITIAIWRQEADDRWQFETSLGTARIGPQADAVIVGADLASTWREVLLYGFLPPGVASIESTDLPGGTALVAETGAYLLVLGERHRFADLASVGWRMRDANGRVVREGHGDCCL